VSERVREKERERERGDGKKRKGKREKTAWYIVVYAGGYRGWSVGQSIQER